MAQQYKKPYYAQYLNQKYRAEIIRNIEWNFTYDEWITWWGDDIQKRGRLKGQLVMARNGDTGPYHPDNVRKITTEANTLERRYSHNEESKKKIGDACRGKKQSEERKRNTSIAITKWWNERKETQDAPIWTS